MRLDWSQKPKLIKNVLVLLLLGVILVVTYTASPSRWWSPGPPTASALSAVCLT
ncbi:MAG TPA: hypothetical protein VI488_11995 [Candidatus Angelobacter sp.]